MMSINIENIKIVCFLNIQGKGFGILENLFDNQNTGIYCNFINEHIYEYITDWFVNDKLKEQEVVKLSSNGVLKDKQSDEWKLALISDDYTASKAIEIMAKYKLFSPYTLILYHNLPRDIKPELSKYQCFAMAQGQHELYDGAIYPKVISVIKAILNKNENNFDDCFQKLSRAIMCGDPNFINLQTGITQRHTETIDHRKIEIYKEIFGEN